MKLMKLHIQLYITFANPLNDKNIGYGVTKY